MRNSGDWSQYMIDLPMAEAPGEKFEYCNGVSYLLSVIIQKTTNIWNSDIRIERETVLLKKTPRARIRNFQLTAVSCIWRRPVPG